MPLSSTVDNLSCNHSAHDYLEAQLSQWTGPHLTDFCSVFSTTPHIRSSTAARRGEVAWWEEPTSPLSWLAEPHRTITSRRWVAPTSLTWITHSLSLSRSFCSMLIVAQLSGHAFFKDHHSLLTTFNYKTTIILVVCVGLLTRLKSEQTIYWYRCKIIQTEKIWQTTKGFLCMAYNQY